MAFGLRPTGAEQADAITDLRAYVLRAATHALMRRDGALGGPVHGMGLFVRDQHALVAARRKRWKRMALDQVILISMNRRLRRDAPADPIAWPCNVRRWR